jgi:NAD(P)H-dependent FMN reductase
MTSLKIFALAGSTRKDSFNKKLLDVAANAARAAGAEVTVVHLDDYQMPLYDGDLEADSGLPERAAALKQMMAESHAFLIASPEYNASMSAVLKNAIDWASRPGAVEGSVFQGKPAALLSASPGALGGLRGLNHLRDILGNLGVLVLAQQQALPKAHEAFAEDGTLTDEGAAKRLESLVNELLKLAGKLRED